MAVISRMGAAAQAASLLYSALTIPAAASETLPLSHAQGDLWAAVGIGNTTISCVVDTGASIVQIDAAVFRRTGAAFAQIGTATFTNASGGTTHMRVGTVSVRLGNVRLDGVRVALREGDGEADCLLGQTALSRFPAVLMDFRHGQLILQTED